MTPSDTDRLLDDVWRRFLDDAIPALQEAARRVNEEPRRRKLEGRPGWLCKPNKALGGARLPDETAISRALVDEMSKMRAAQYIAAPAGNVVGPDLTRMEFHFEEDRKYDPAIGPRRQPTDIQIAIHRDGVDLRLEAKKLTQPSSVNSEYLGPSGLGRFDDTDAPYTLERFGGMMAYVTDRDALYWENLIGVALRADMPSERVTSTLVSGRSLCTTIHVRDVDIEVHDVKGRFRTDVIHMVFEFEAVPSRRALPTVSIT